MRLYHKRGGVPDFIYFIVFIFAFALIVMFSYKFLTGFNTTIQADQNLDSRAKQIMQNTEDRYIGIFDSSFLIVFLGLFAAICIGVWFIYTHPSLYWLTFPIAAIIIFIALFFGNLFQGISNMDEVIATFQAFPIMSFIWDNWIKIIVVMVVFFWVMLFAKNNNSVDQQ